MTEYNTPDDDFPTLGISNTARYENHTDERFSVEYVVMFFVNMRVRKIKNSQGIDLNMFI